MILGDINLNDYMRMLKKERKRKRRVIEIDRKGKNES